MCNPSTGDVEVRVSAVQGEPGPRETESQKIKYFKGWSSWHMPVIPAALEREEDTGRKTKVTHNTCSQIPNCLLNADDLKLPVFN